MNIPPEESTTDRFAHGFINRKGEPILVTTLDDKRSRRLIEMYLSFQPRNSFQGLPPISDTACEEWVKQMIRTGVNLVALSFEEGVVGHVALFPISGEKSEMLVVVSPPFQNTGIGTELVRCAIQLSDELGFEELQITVEATNVRARHVYKKCGFEYLLYEHVGEVEMALDLKRHRDTMNVSVAKIMNRDVLAVRNDEPCRVALGIFLDHHIGSLPVISAEGKLVGIISKTDLMLPSNIGRKVGDVLTREVLTVQEGCPIGKVIRMFQVRKIRGIPVVDCGSRLIGIVGREDVLAYYAENVESPTED